MFHSIVSQLTNRVRTAVRAIGSTTRRTPWLIPTVILAFFLFL